MVLCKLTEFFLETKFSGTKNCCCEFLPYMYTFSLLNQLSTRGNVKISSLLLRVYIEKKDMQAYVNIGGTHTIVPPVPPSMRKSAPLSISTRMHVCLHPKTKELENILEMLKFVKKVYLNC